MKTRLLVPACTVLVLTFHSSSSLAAVLAEQVFSSGLGSYGAAGSVSTGSTGARLSGGSSPGRLTSAAIDTTGHRQIRVTVNRSTTGLDLGEAGSIVAVVNGQSRTLESVRSASGAATFDLGDNAGRVTLQFAVAASSLLESYTVASVRVEGVPTSTEPPVRTGTLVPDASWTCGLPGGIPDPATGTPVFDTTLSADAPIVVGATPYGQRRVIRTTGGALSGGSLGGSVLSGSLDFDLQLPSGAQEHESRHTLRASDGTLIYVRLCGVADGPGQRVVADFEAPSSSTWQWLNSGTYVGRREVTASGIRLSVSAVSATPNPADPVTRVPADNALKQQPFNCAVAPASAAQGAQVLVARVNIGSSQSVGTSKRGRRNIIPITGGTYSGSFGSGSVNPGGADHQLTVSGGLQVEARYTLKAANGETIVVRNCGDFGSADLTAVTFEAPTGGAFAAMNSGSYVGTITPGLGRVTITVYERR